jgi:hypothetical protein
MYKLIKIKACISETNKKVGKRRNSGLKECKKVISNCNYIKKRISNCIENKRNINNITIEIIIKKT